MSVWLILPSARPVEEAEACLKLWNDRGYRIGVFREMERGRVGADLLINTVPYTGYAAAVNLLAKTVLDIDSEASWLVAAGDDTEPDRAEPWSIANQCSSHFMANAPNALQADLMQRCVVGHGCMTFGVMQPTGDRWNCSPGYSDKPTIERVAGSPWLGRDWCRRAYGGRGPLWPEYYHCFADEEFQLVAQRLGVFWQRPDLVHLHHNWARAETVADHVRIAIEGPPEFLLRANSEDEWNRSQSLFNARKSAGFPGSNPL